MRKQAVAPSSVPMAIEPAASKTGLPVMCTSAVAAPSQLVPVSCCVQPGRLMCVKRDVKTVTVRPASSA